jgi:trimeric autotransporter adhesin
MGLLPKIVFYWFLAGYLWADVEAPSNPEAIVSESAGQNAPDRLPAPFSAATRTSRLAVRHVQGAGVGYTRSYSTVEGFIAIPPVCYQHFCPFIDLRGHIFNDGRMAANAGIGLRYVNPITWGGNVYYDYRRTKRYHYNQAGAGLEAIGSFWSCSLNGYWPFGRKKSHIFDLTLGSPNFLFFQGNQLFIGAFTAKQEFAFKGLDASVVFCCYQKGLFSLDVGAGPYFFHGYKKKYAAGGLARLTARFSDYFALRLVGSYDNLFHDRIQGEAVFSIPLGPKHFSKKCPESACPIPSYFDSRLSRGAERSEIIVVDRHEKAGTAALAIDPSTGLPYVIWFVDNTSHSNGTFESPFSTLAQAQAASGPNDLIYVFAGDGSDTGMDHGIVLKDGQQLLGAGADATLPTTLGTVTIPALSSSKPLIANNGAFLTAVTLANNNRISGIHIPGGTEFGFTSATPIQNLQIENCQIESNAYSVNLTDFTGIATISGNNLSNYGTIGVQFVSASGTSNIAIADSTFTGRGVSTAIRLMPSGAADMTASITGNTMSNHAAPTIWGTADATFAVTVANNHITGIVGTSQKGILFDSFSASGVWSAVITGNVVDGGFGHTDIFLNPLGSSTISSAIVSNNIVLGPGIGAPYGIELFAEDTANVISLAITDNQSQNHTDAEIGVLAFGTNNHIAATISGNYVQHTSGNDGIQIINSDMVAGNSMNVTVSNNTCDDTNNGIGVYAQQSASVNATILGNRCINVPNNNNGVHVNTDNTASATVAITSNTITPAAGSTGHGINLNNQGSSSLSAFISGNTVSHFDAMSISLHYQGDAASQFTCSILNNMLAIGPNGFGSIGILAEDNGGATGNLLISGNQITTDAGALGSHFGILYLAGNTTGADHAVTITHNTVTECGNGSIVGFLPTPSGICVSNMTTDHLSADIESNTATQCGVTMGYGGFIISRTDSIAGVNTLLCATLRNNSSMTNNPLVPGYTVINYDGAGPLPTGPNTAVYIKQSGNIGTFAPLPIIWTNWIVGPCPPP